MKFILVRAPKEQYLLFKSLDNSITIIVFKNSLNQKRRKKSDFIVGQQLIITSSLIYISIILATLIEK